jgi:two-component system phosphate regulon sensor histidine kinase PhoR
MQDKNQQTGPLIELNEELEDYFHNTLIGQVFVDANLILRKYTPRAMKQFNLKDDFMGMHLAEIKETFSYPKIIEHISAVLATSEIFENKIQTIDGSWYEINMLPYHVRKENKTNGVIITFIDITSRMHALKEHEKLAAEHESLLETFGHDLKNSILGLSLTIQMLKKLSNNSPDKSSLLWNNVDAGLSSMKKIIGDVIDSRWTRKQDQAEEELLDVGNILEDVSMILAQQIQQSGAVIHQHLECPEVWFVRRKLRSVMCNLLSNALEYPPSDRNLEVAVTCRKENDYVVISVADNGLGMSSEQQKIIFNKYDPKKTESECAGVGLYLSNTIVTSAGGKIEVQSKLGHGSVFKVYLKDASYQI